MTKLMIVIRKRMDARRAYNRAMAEIEALNTRDLIDLGADRADLQAGVYRQIYG